MEIPFLSDNLKQHIVPRFYIAFFRATNDTKVFTRVKGLPGILLKPPKRQGYVEEAFTVLNGDERDTSCDETNKKLENWCAPRLARLTAASPPTDDQWRAVFYLTANLLCRSRRTREHALSQMNLVQEGLPKVIEAMKGSQPFPEDICDFGFSQEEWAELRGVLERAAKLQFPLTAGLGTVPVAEELKAGKDCDLLIPPAGTTFITSDDPSVVLEGGKPVMMKVARGFIARPEVEVYMPLKPDIACLWSAKSVRVVRSVTAVEVAAYNRLIWESCYERAFASRKCDLEEL